MLDKYDVNVFKPKWVLSSIAKGEVQDIAPKYMLHVMNLMREKVRSGYDKYGDNYLKLSTPEDIKDLVEEMNVKEEDILTDTEIMALKEELKAQMIQIDHPYRY